MKGEGLLGTEEEAKGSKGGRNSLWTRGKVWGAREKQMEAVILIWVDAGGRGGSKSCEPTM